MDGLLDMNSLEGEKIKKQNKLYLLIIIVLSVIIVILSVILGITLSSNSFYQTIPSESIIEPTKEIAVNGLIVNGSGAHYNRTADVKKSPYYPIINFYSNNGISKTIKLLPNFKTYQQTTPTSCGDASAFMALRYLGINNVTEDALFKEAGTTDKGTNTLPLAAAIEKLAGQSIKAEAKTNNDVLSEQEYLTLVKNCTNPKNNCVVIMESVEWGGHWMTLIGYDDMGTTETADDVLIFADPFDTTDHNQDGYYIVSFERYYATWFDHNVLPEGHRGNQYIKISKK